MIGYYIENKYADCVTYKTVYADEHEQAIKRAKQALATCENPKDVIECRLYEYDMYGKEDTRKLVKVIKK